MQSKPLLAIIIFAAMALALNIGYNAFPSPKHLIFSAPAITDTGKGNLVEFEMFFIKGEGRTLVNIQNSAFKEDVEDALRKARANADNYLGIHSSKWDLVMELRGGVANEVSGESAGGMFAVAIVALQTGRNLRQDVAISASISENGTLEDVGGIEEKIIAARESGRKLFLVSGTQQIKDAEGLEKGIRLIRVNSLKDALAYLIE